MLVSQKNLTDQHTDQQCHLLHYKQWVNTLFTGLENRRTCKRDDVVPLCANCHRLAHTRSPPIPIDELRGIVKEEAVG